MVLKRIVLREHPSHDDVDWNFAIPQEYLSFRSQNKGKLVTLDKDAISLTIDQVSSNRILHADDASKFLHLSINRNFRFEELPMRSVVEYLNRMFKAGFFLNGVQYRFYHHSNSQLRGRSCFLREASTDAELDSRIYAMGDFSRIMNVAKRAKRIGLLFSTAQIDFNLDPKYIIDIPDIQSGDEIFSDGCGLMSKSLAIQVSRAKRIIFRATRYTPTVFQIRYLGYKGVLMLHPQMDADNKSQTDPALRHLAEFRKSMKKFTTTADQSFSVVGFSVPYSFGRLNNDIIVLLSSLGISNEKLLAKQDEYFLWLKAASRDPVQAVDFLSCVGNYPLAEKVFLEGLEDSQTTKQIHKLQLSELARHHDAERDTFKTRMMIRQSRRLFGVCDPFQVLKEGQVHIRITAGRKGPSTPIHGDVLVVRNPCLHPGDCLKLRAVDHEKLSHLVDCIVFATVAKPDHRAAPSMSSGGDLDGDEFFVCWDKDLVPSRVVESYDYPGNKEYNSRVITRADLANHFASYNASGLARVSALHNKWARSSPQGALSPECQELNALHSQSVDGAGIKIPERLKTPPEPTEPFIIDLLRQKEEEFELKFKTEEVDTTTIATLNADEARKLVERLFKSKQDALSEYEMFNLALRLSRKHSFDIRFFLPQIDMSAFSAIQKHVMSATLDLSAVDYPYIWNSLLRSDILRPQDLMRRSLNSSFSLQRLYSSNTNGLATFFEFLRRGTQDYTRKLLIIQTDERFAVGIFMKGEIPWDEEPEVNDNVVVVSFMPQSSATVATQRPCTKGYRLHCSHSKFELYNKQRSDTFIFINRSPVGHSSEIVASIALQKISETVRRQMGRVNRTPIVKVELHVVSNHDRVAHQLFDLWFEHVPTEEYVPRFIRQAAPYRLNDLRDVDWSSPMGAGSDVDQEPGEGAGENEEFARRLEKRQRELEAINEVFNRFPEDMLLPPGKRRQQHTQSSIDPFLSTRSLLELDKILEFGIKYHSEDEVFLVFRHILSRKPLDDVLIVKWLENYPTLAFALLQHYPPTEDSALALEVEDIGIAESVIKAIICSANDTQIAALVALEKIAKATASLSWGQYFGLLMFTALSVRSQQLVQEVLLVLNESRINYMPPLPANIYAHKHALNIVFDRTEEAADECPCNEQGRPRRQKTAPAQAKIKFVSESESLMMINAAVRIDARTSIRLHSHVRLQATSKAENRFINTPVLDGLVIQAMKGEFRIKLMQPPPPELERMDWSIYSAGGVATSQAELDALLRLMTEREGCCRFYSYITGDDTTEMEEDQSENRGEGERSGDQDAENQPWVESQSVEIILPPSVNLNESQISAIGSWSANLSLIWGPPGTGKTTVVVQILRSIIMTYQSNLPKILMTASTHNAVDNVLERFIKFNSTDNLLSEDQILRVATDQSKVNQNLQQYTIDARVGGDINQNNRLLKQAQARVKKAVLIFTTCAGAGLGLLRKINFDIAIIDEASQITEPCALVPLVKGIKKAIMVGDHVQLRPMVRKMGMVLESDVSLLERLYTQVQLGGMGKTMLDVQYRSPRVLNAFPSNEFYHDRLKTHEGNEAKLQLLEALTFPWPKREGQVVPVIFIQCGHEEDMGHRSKSNDGQVAVVLHVLELLKPRTEVQDPPSLGITVLSPYTKQVQKLRHRLPSSISSSTIDSFQGRESDIIIFSTVRCNAEGDVGFLEDPRRLNVMWTRAKLALIIIGDERTLKENAQWQRAMEACTTVQIDVGESA